VDLLINSHYHNDHVWGNQVFGWETDIISAADTRQLMLSKGPEEQNAFDQHAASELASLLAEADTTTDDVDCYNLSFWIDYYQAYVDAEPRIVPRLPDITFVEHLTICGSQRSAELIVFTGAHSASDSVLWLPDDRIVFMSDLLFVGCHPFLGEANPEGLLAALEAVADLNPETLVPGHGPSGTMKDLELMMRYVRDVDQLARGLLDQSAGADTHLAVTVPEPYAGWDLARYFLINLQALSERQDQGVGVSD
jgi:glyoxylase-like metal-dependent hydrolase (beta-lactamase superfamily II)